MAANSSSSSNPISISQNKILKHVASLITPGSSVLDVGCGDGHLLELLKRENQAKARGLEISRTGVATCVAKGLSVVQGDANTDLEDYPDQSFDFVVLTQTIQAMTRPLNTLQQTLRIGEHVIVSTPNFAHWRLRLSLLLFGKMPQSQSLPAQWFETDNIHLCTLTDFIDLCNDHKISITQSYAGKTGQTPSSFQPWGFAKKIANLSAEEAVFLLNKK